MMTGTSLSRRSRRQTSKPSSPGSITSSTTTSTVASRMPSSAASPVSAGRTLIAETAQSQLQALPGSRIILD